MAISDGVFVSTYLDALNNVIALDLSDVDGFALALFTNSLVPDFSQAGAAYGADPFDANEVSGTGYSAGGQALAGADFDESSTPGMVRWTFASPVEWTSSTLSNVRGGLFYASALSNRAVLLRTFGQDYATQDGTLSISWGSNGVLTHTL